MTIAVVTGGGSGIGRAVSVLLASRAIPVAVMDVDVAAATQVSEEAVRAGGIAVPIGCDVASEEEVSRAAAEVARLLGSEVSILVNSAGIPGPNVPLAEMDLATWRRVFAVNTEGTFLACRAFVPWMVSGRYGRIVNVASVAGKEGNALNSGYSAAKAAVIGLTKSLGRELAGTGVLVNAVTPSLVNSPMGRAAAPGRRAELLARVPLARMVEPEEVAELVGWLCSEKCTFTTAAVFDISGGRATY